MVLMNSELSIDTIEGRIASLEAISKNNQKSLKFDSVTDEDLVNLGYYGIFWDKDIQRNWVRNIIIRTQEKTLRFDQTTLALQFLVLWDYFEDDFRIVWDQCTIPPTRLRSISRSEIISIILGFNYLFHHKESIDEKITELLIQSHHLEELSIIYKPKTGFQVLESTINQLVDESDITIEICGLILLQYNLLSDKNNNQTFQILKKNFEVLEPALVYVTQMDISNQSLTAASLFRYLDLHRMKGYSLKLESGIGITNDIQHLHPIKRVTPLLVLLLITVIEAVRFYVAPNDSILAAILLSLVITLFWILFGIADDGKLKLGYLNALTDFIIRMGENKKKN